MFLFLVHLNPLRFPMFFRHIKIPAIWRPLSLPFPSQAHCWTKTSLKSFPLARAFSVSASCRIMELTGFSQEQLDVREAVAKICSNYPDEYWAERDETGEYPHELHAALAKNGWIGIALPEDLGGAGLGISEATMMLQTISQSGAGIAGAQSVHANVYATQPVARFATANQKKAMLRRLISGEVKACFGVTEPRSEDR